MSFHFYPQLGAADRGCLGIYSVGTSVMAPGTVVRRPAWHCWQFMYHLEGAGTAAVGAESLEMEAGDITLLPPDISHGYQVREGASGLRYWWIEFLGECVPALLAMLRLTGRWHVAGCGEEVGSIVHRINTHFASRGDAANQENAILFLHALAVAARCASRAQPIAGAAGAIDRVKSHMAERLAEQLRLVDLAAVAEMSPYHLTRVFHGATGLPPMRYLRRLRANRAKALLHRPELKAREVGRAVGYRVVQHFSRMFKQETGMTARSFQRGIARERAR